MLRLKCKESEYLVFNEVLLKMTRGLGAYPPTLLFLTLHPVPPGQLSPRIMRFTSHTSYQIQFRISHWGTYPRGTRFITSVLR